MADILNEALVKAQAGRQALAAGRLSEAIALLQESVAMDDSRLDVREMLAASLCRSGDAAAGIILFESIVENHPTSPQAHFNLASALQQVNRTEDALKHVEVALRLDPHYAKALAAREAWTPRPTAAPAPGSKPASRRTTPTGRKFDPNLHLKLALPAPAVPVAALPPGPWKANAPPSTTHRLSDELARAEEPCPGVWEVFIDTLREPAETLTTSLPSCASTAPGLNGMYSLFVVSAILWAAPQALEPATGVRSGGVIAMDLFLALFSPVLIIALQAAVAAGFCAAAAGGYSNAFRNLGVRFGFAWSAASLICMLVATLFLAAYYASARAIYIGPLPFMTGVVIWTFVLNMLVLRGLYGFDFGRAFITILFAQLIGSGIGIALVQAVLLSQ